MKDDTRNILIGGEAGQGLVTTGVILARSLVRAGYRIVVTQSYQSRIRGGHNTFAIRVSSREIHAPREEIDLLVALNAEAAALHRQEVAGGGCIMVDAALDLEGDPRLLRVPFKDLVKGRQVNIAALGAAGALLGLDGELLARTLEDFLGGKKPGLIEDNSLRESFAWGRAHRPASFRVLSSPGSGEERVMLNGNEAIALGALSAGLKFAAFYPMTPATSVNLVLIAHAEEMGIIVEQAEDEIAAVNMAVGASFAGAPSMVATSGGGFALMTEGVSLAAMTETPLVVVVAQRPGPATGLPTRTAQADLEFVLHAGHGEFPRAVFAPGDVEECFHLTRRAFETAERFQGPVFILTDQFLADSYRAVSPFPVKDLECVRAGARGDDIERPYRRYAFAEDGVSPRLLPGMTEHLVVADSDEHTEDGHLTEDLDVAGRMTEKRLRKGRGMAAEVIPPASYGDERPEMLLVVWGSSGGAALEASAAMRKEGRRVQVLHFSQVWPLAAEQFMDCLEKAGEVICVEGNATGQFARLIRRETGFEIKKKILRYDGLPLTPAFILRGIS